MMEYKGYAGNVDFDDEAKTFHGEVMNLRDVITFQGETVKELVKAFHESVDDYLEFCAERGESPEKPFSGKFMVRVEPELHKAVAMHAKTEHKSLNAWVHDTLKLAAMTGKAPSNYPGGRAKRTRRPSGIRSGRKPKRAKPSRQKSASHKT